MSDIGSATRTTRAAVDVWVPARDADADELWRLLSTPALWPTWAPHIRRATRAAGPAEGRSGDAHDDAAALAPGDRVRIDGHGPVAVTAWITLVDPPRRWDFLVPLPLFHQLTATHELVDAPAGVRVRMALHGPLPSRLGGLLLRVYEPLAAVAVRRLVALAADPARPRRATRMERSER